MQFAKPRPMHSLCIMLSRKRYWTRFLDSSINILGSMCYRLPATIRNRFRFLNKKNKLRYSNQTKNLNVCSIQNTDFNNHITRLLPLWPSAHFSEPR